MKKRSRSTRKSSAMDFLSTPPATAAASPVKWMSESPKPFEFNFKKFKAGTITPTSSKRRSEKKSFISSPVQLKSAGSPASVKNLKKIADLKEFASSQLDSVKGQVERSHMEILKELEASQSRLQKRLKQWYNLSKTLAEAATWEFAKENGIDLVTLHPGLVIGPFLQPTLNLSFEFILNFITQGKEAWSGGIYKLVDVRDVANAHILAFEVASANGRYCLVGANGYSSSLLKILQKLYPSINIPGNVEEYGLPMTPIFQISGERAKTIGVKYMCLELSVKDTVKNLIQKNFLNIKTQN